MSQSSAPPSIPIGYYVASSWTTINQNIRRILPCAKLSTVEFGGVKLLPMAHTSDYVAIMAERLPNLVEAMCQNEHYQCRSDDKVFRMNTIGSYSVARVNLDKHFLSFELHELRDLLYIFYMVRNQLLMYTEALSDVQSYVNVAMTSDNCVEPTPTASRSTANFSRISNHPCNALFNKLDRITACLLLFSHPFPFTEWIWVRHMTHNPLWRTATHQRWQLLLNIPALRLGWPLFHAQRHASMEGTAPFPIWFFRRSHGILYRLATLTPHPYCPKFRRILVYW